MGYLYALYIRVLLVCLAEIIYVSEHATSPNRDWWIKSLKLYQSDRRILLDGEMLNDALINACQKLLSNQFPEILGFENTICGLTSTNFSLKEFAHHGIQILHIGMSPLSCFAA